MIAKQINKFANDYARANYVIFQNLTHPIREHHKRKNLRWHAEQLQLRQQGSLQCSDPFTHPPHGFTSPYYPDGSPLGDRYCPGREYDRTDVAVPSRKTSGWEALVGESYEVIRQRLDGSVVSYTSGSERLKVDVDANGIVVAIWYANQLLPFDLEEIVPSSAGVGLRERTVVNVHIVGVKVRRD